MSTILNSLQKLAVSVENLEASIDLFKASTNQNTGAQTDMFATKLDETINKVEIVLGEHA